MSSQPPGPDIRVDFDGAVTIITIDRPHRRNAVDRDTASALYDAFLAFESDPAASCAVLTGAGGTFCAGADLTSIAADEPNVVSTPDPAGIIGSLAPMGPTRLNLSKPVVAAVEGHAVAGGLELALWADLRVVAHDAVLGVFCRRWGVPLIDGGTVRLPRLVGESRAMDLILTGRPVLADEALAIGLAHRVVPAGSAAEAAVALAQELASLPQQCLRVDRASVVRQRGVDEPTALSDEVAGAIDLLRSGAVRAGAARFAGLSAGASAP